MKLSSKDIFRYNFDKVIFLLFLTKYRLTVLTPLSIKIDFIFFDNLSQIDVFNFLIQFVEDQSFQIAFFLQQEIGINLQNKKQKQKMK
jgi:hypothetical protein